MKYNILALCFLCLFIRCTKEVSVPSLPQISYNEELAILGENLFTNRKLSPKNISCADCHDSSKYFQDGYEVALAGTDILTRNTLSLLNTNFYTNYFWDGRVQSLREQIKQPLFGRIEMNSNDSLIRNVILTDSIYRSSFSTIPEEQYVDRIIKALEQYVLSIGTEKIDLEDNKDIKVYEGYKIFKKYKCDSCHKTPLFTDNQFHDIGLYRKHNMVVGKMINQEMHYSLTFDYGRGNIASGEESIYKYRTPSLINVALTAPYMHDGRYSSLGEVLDFYERKGKVELSKEEKKKLLLFLEALSDTRYSY